MKTLTGASSKIILDNYRDRSFCSSRDPYPNRQEICALPWKKVVYNVGFLHLISVKHKLIQPICSSSSLSPESQANLETAETQLQETYQSKIVHVKFQLQKECLFGEQFFIVGHDPIFGLWDPTSAIPLNWSAGHVWTVEMDVPVEKSVQFKFILKESTGNILWQPGPDRILKTWETNNTITVCEDWESPEYQKIIEEEPLASQNAKPIINSEKSVVIVDNNTYPAKQPAPETLADNITPTQEKPIAFVAENIGNPKEDLKVNASNKALGKKKITPQEESVAISNKNTMIAEDIIGNNSRAATVRNPANTDVEGNLITHEEGPVLVPGLTPLSTAADEEIKGEDEKSIAIDASVGVNEAKNHYTAELDDKQEPGGDLQQEVISTLDIIQLDDKQEPGGDLQQEVTTEILNHKEKQLDNQLNQGHQFSQEQQLNSEPFDNKVLQNDIQWGRKTLQKLLTNLGLRWSD